MVSMSGYCSWRNRPTSSTARRRGELAARIRYWCDDSDRTYGYRRVAAELARAVETVHPATVRSIMGAEGLVAAQPQSFNATLKNERVHRRVYRTVDEAIRDAVSWIELRYNQKRCHSSLNYRTPNDVETGYRNFRQAV